MVMENRGIMLAVAWLSIAIISFAAIWVGGFNLWTALFVIGLVGLMWILSLIISDVPKNKA